MRWLLILSAHSKRREKLFGVKSVKNQGLFTKIRSIVIKVILVLKKWTRCNIHVNAGYSHQVILWRIIYLCQQTSHAIHLLVHSTIQKLGRF